MSTVRDAYFLWILKFCFMNRQSADFLYMRAYTMNQLFILTRAH